VVEDEGRNAPKPNLDLVPLNLGAVLRDRKKCEHRHFFGWSASYPPSSPKDFAVA